MLDELHVENVALIRDASFSPAAGLTVITGETGAGKTALLSAFKLLAGERADAASVREGAASALVEGRFFIEGVDAAEGCVVSRRLSADGRSRASLDGAMATVGQLAATVGATVDLCGQHEHQSALKPANHVRMLDAWAHDAVDAPGRAYAEALAAAQRAADELARIEGAAATSAERLDQERFVLARIDELSPSLEEYDDIMRELPRVENAEALSQASSAAYEELSCDGGALDALRAAIRSLESVVQVDASLGGALEALTDAAYAVEDASREVRVYRDGIDHDPGALARLQERAAALQSLMRSYGPRMEDVLARRDEAARLVAAVDDAETQVAQARRALDAAESALARAAAALDEARAAAAPEFAARVNAQMARLEMGTAELVCRIDPLPREQWGRAGASKVEFFYRAAEGLTARPLARIASGGEMSRVMLACKVALGAADERQTLVFDEVDAGVGGSVALALADVLADLAKTHQVIVVTHLAQIAVRGQAHYLVAKLPEGADGIPETTLRRIEGDDRVAEIARMLSGDAGQTSRAHAAEMLDAAARKG